MVKDFSEAVQTYGGAAEAFQALGYEKNADGAWTNPGSQIGADRVVGDAGYDANYDYSAGMDAAQMAGNTAVYNQLAAERQAKIDAVYGGNEPTMFGSNQTYSQAHSAAAAGNADAQQAINNAVAFENKYGETYRNEPGAKEVYQQAQAGNWGAAFGKNSQIEQQYYGEATADGWKATDQSKAVRDYGSGVANLFGYNATDYINEQYDKAYGAGSAALYDATGGKIKSVKELFELNDAETAQKVLDYYGIKTDTGSTTGSNNNNQQTTTSPGATTGTTNTGTSVSGTGGGTASGGSASVSNDWATLLNQWLTNAQTQQGNSIDFATNQAIAELQRTQQDAAATYQEQRDQVAVDEAKAKDNQALYAEARGDKGGIGAAQYDAIMANAAKSRLSVNQAQTKLATDTARQISDLRAQGAYEKADALLELSQQYLSQLISLQQWQMEYNLDYEKFRQQLAQWDAEFKLAEAEITGTYNGQTTLSYSKYQNEMLAEQGWLLLGGGVMPSQAQLGAMGMTSAQAQEYIATAKLSAASGEGATPGYTSTSVSKLFTDASKTEFPETYIREKYEDYGLTTVSGLVEQYEAWVGTHDVKHEGAYNSAVTSLDALYDEYKTNAVKVIGSQADSIAVKAEYEGMLREAIASMLADKTISQAEADELLIIYGGGAN